MELIKNKKNWIKYKKIQDGRVKPLESIHKPESPDNYPCLVISNLTNAGYKMIINYSFVYRKDAEKLIK